MSGWACSHSRPLWVSPTNSPLRLGVSPAAASTPMSVYNQGFEAYFPMLEPWVAWSVSLPPLFLPVYLCANVGPQGLPATTSWGLLTAAWPALFHNPPLHWVRQPLPCCKSSLPQLPFPPPPPGLDECFFFISLVVGLPYSLIFCHFWLFFVFKLLLSFWLCEEAQCIYLCLHLGRKSHTIFNLPLSIFYLPIMLLIPCTFSSILPPRPSPLITLHVCDLHFWNSVPILVAEVVFVFVF